MAANDKVVDFSIPNCFCKEKALTVICALLPDADECSLGMTESNLFSKLGIKDGEEKTCGALAWLINAGIVTNKYCQEGTAGPYGYRYKLNKEKIRVRISIAEQ